MEDTLKLDMTEEEARARDAEMDRMLVAMRQANEHIARRQQEIKQLQEETDSIIAEIKERSRVGTTI
ncbi:MAG: hypothetical protein ACRD9Y_25835 [Blastocatellia bacterium]